MYRFYRARRAAGEAQRWYLTRGAGGRHTDRIWLKAPERASQKRRKVASDIRILNIATDRLKDAVATSLRLVEPGQNYCFIPEWMEEPHLVEFTAERRTAKGWEKRPGMVRNESLDLAVQARAVHILKGGEKINPERPPSWALGGSENSNAVQLAADADQSAPQTVAPKPPRRRRSAPMRI